MSLEIITQDTILDKALSLTQEATRRIWLTSPWITRAPVERLLQQAVSRGNLDVRVVYRVKEPADLEITDLEALKALELAGCKVRFSTRLHAKLLLVDERSAIVSSSNLTATAGYGLEGLVAARNEELGIFLQDEVTALRDLETEFLKIWETTSALTEETIGIVMDSPDVYTFRFVAIRDVHQGAYATVHDVDGHIVVGRIRNITAFNRTFPAEEPGWTGFRGRPGLGALRGGRPADVKALFSHPSKEHGFLVAKTLLEPESLYRIAEVEVLKNLEGARLVSPTAPTRPGADVTRASGETLARLLGEGEVPVGTVLHHPEVPVALRADEIFSKHMAVLGMTGAGKSNSLKLLIRNILANPRYQQLRVVVVDTHGEYSPILVSLASSSTILDVELRRSILDEAVLKDALGVSRTNDAAFQRAAAILARLEDGATIETLIGQLEVDASVGGEQAGKIRRLTQLLRETTEFCIREEDEVRIVQTGDPPSPEDLAEPGLYVLDLRLTDDHIRRADKTAALLDHVFRRAKETFGNFPALIVVDEAQNYVPEQHTGWLKEMKSSFDAVFQIASEGRKFGVGLVVSTQRPARVNKDILSQCNTHMIFRVANMEDLAAIAGSFEAASKPLLDELPGYDTGVCVVGGTAIGMVTRVEVPLFE